MLAKQLPAALMAVIDRKAQGRMHDYTADIASSTIKATYELRRPDSFWGFKALPKDVDMQRILREAPADARMVTVTVGTLRFVYLRKTVREAMQGLPYGWFVHTRGFILQSTKASNLCWLYCGTLDGWHGMVFSTTDFGAIDIVRKCLAAYDAAEAAKKKAEAHKIEAKVESF